MHAQLELWRPAEERPESMSAPAARSILEQTGWERGNKERICQDIAVLEAIREYDYDLNAPGFLEYFEGRTGYRLRAVRGKWTSMLGRPGWAAPASDRHERILQGKLQDCWEIWQGRENET